MNNKIYKKCPRCGGTGKVKIKEGPLLTVDTKKMLSIMKKHNLTQSQLAKILDISQGTVSGWFKRKTNLQGKIKKIYFTMLKDRGWA